MLTTEKIVTKDLKGYDVVWYRAKVVLSTGEVVGEAVFGTPENARYFAVRDAWARGHGTAALGHARSSSDKDLQEWAEQVDVVAEGDRKGVATLAEEHPIWLLDFEKWCAKKKAEGLVQ